MIKEKMAQIIREYRNTIIVPEEIVDKILTLLRSSVPAEKSMRYEWDDRVDIGEIHIAERIGYNAYRTELMKLLNEGAI